MCQQKWHRLTSTSTTAQTRALAPKRSHCVEDHVASDRCCLLRRIKRLKEALDFLGSDTRPGIAHRHQDGTRLIPGGADRQFTRPNRAHRINGIGNKDQQHLLELHPVAFNLNTEFCYNVLNVLDNARKASDHNVQERATRWARSSFCISASETLLTSRDIFTPPMRLSSLRCTNRS
jgi:hypothetical protein